MSREHIIAQATIGISSSLAAVGLTMTQFEQGLRISGALVGIAVGLLTLFNIVRGMRRKAE
ncbi:MAG TPA: hypothetical protein VGN72_00170 [Tepidisphaeraceae bacterium]|nr:hypothetical protein [Tepidisphaeraceae bacterium]